MPPISGKKLLETNSLAATTALVSAGSSAPMESKASWKLGITVFSKMITTATATTRTTIG